MKTIHIGLLCLSTCLVAGTAHAQKKPGCGADVPVSVRVLDAPDGQDEYLTYVLRSDGGGAYVDGKGRIDARIQLENCTNDLWVGLGLSTRRMHVVDPAGITMVTSFNLDRAGAVRTDDDAAMDAHCSALPPDNYGGCGVDSRGRFVRRAVTFQWSLGNNDILKMQRAPEDSTTFQNELETTTSWVRVYHTADTVTGVRTWILSPEPTTDGTAVAGHIARPRKGLPSYRPIALPFRIEVTTMP